MGVSISEHLQEVKKDRPLSMVVSGMVVASERACQRNKENAVRSQIPGVSTMVFFVVHSSLKGVLQVLK